MMHNRMEQMGGRGSAGTLICLAFLAFTVTAWGGGAYAQEYPSPMETATLFGTEYGDAYTSVFLNQLFGPLFPSVTGSTSKTVFSEIIGYFNVIILVVGGLMMFWNMTTGILQSAYEGQVLGARWSSLWAPLRVIFSVGLLVPIPGLSGYNLGEAGIAYIIKGSTNIASSVWETSAELVIKGETPITANPAQIDPKIVSTLFTNAACEAIVSQQYNIISEGAPGSAGLTHIEEYNSDGTKKTVMSALVDKNGAVVNKNICGSYTTPDLPRYITALSDSVFVEGIPSDKKSQIKESFINAHQGSVEMLVSDFSTIAQSILPAAMNNGASLPDISSQIASAWNKANINLETNIDAIMDAAVGTDREGQDSRNALLSRIKGSCAESASETDMVDCYGEGWIGAGSWYMMLAQLNNEISSLTAAKSTASKGSYITDYSDGLRDLYIASGGEKGIFINEKKRALESGLATGDEASLWMARMQETFENSTAGLAALGMPMSIDQLGEVNKVVDADSFLNKIPGFGDYRMKIMNKILEITSPSNWGSDPMIGLTRIGHYLISFGGILVAGALIGGVITGGGSASILMPFIAVLVTAGSTLSFILPIMPFFFWVLAVTGYFLLIVEAIIAVNLWGLAHMRLDGEGLSGEAGRMGWLMILSLLMTPVLMVFGFLVGMSIFRITSALIDLGINQAISGIMGGGIFIEFAAIICYGVLISVIYIVLLERSFSLVSEFPGRVLRWMGADAHITNGEEGKVRAAAAGVAGTMYKTSAMPAAIAKQIGGKYGFSKRGDGTQNRDGSYTPGLMHQRMSRSRTNVTGSRSGGGKPSNSG